MINFTGVIRRSRLDITSILSLKVPSSSQVSLITASYGVSPDSILPPEKKFR